MRKMSGVNTPIPTPMTDNGVLDEESLASLCAYLAGSGVQGIYANGTTGEMGYLSPEEREAAAEICVQTAAHRIGVYIMTGAMTTAETVRLSRHAADIGADGIGVVTPYYFGLTDEELYCHFRAVSEAVPEDFPVYLYGIPHCAANDLSVPLVERLAENCPNIIGIKYSEPDMKKLMRFMQIRDGAFSVLPGTEDLFYPALCCGADGVIAGSSNLIPELFAGIYESFRKGDHERARRLQNTANSLLPVINGPQNISRYKEGLCARGVIGSAGIRRPMIPVGDTVRREVRELVSRYLRELPALIL